MEQTRFTLTKANGKFITLDELYDLAKDEVVEFLDGMYERDALYLGNAIRDANNYDRLYENNEDNVNEMLSSESPWDILNDSDWKSGYDYFTYNGSFDMTDDVWYDLDTDEIAEFLLDGSYSRYLSSDLKQIVADFEEARDFLEELHPARVEGVSLLAKYMNCNADVTDLLQFVDKLMKNDEIWDNL